MRLVILESPYAGEVEANVAYARACLKDCLAKGEAPIASHLLYTQPGVLDDLVPDERALGIAAGLAWRKVADAAVFYVDRGWSRGMVAARETYDAEGKPYEVRTLDPALLPAPRRVAGSPAHEAFDAAITSPDPYDERDGPWYDMEHVRRIELATGLSFGGTPRTEDKGLQTDALVDRFAAEMKAKLRAAESRYGWANKWARQDWREECQSELARHVRKGDPRDVAAYAAFCWHHGWPTAEVTVRAAE